MTVALHARAPRATAAACLVALACLPACGGPLEEAPGAPTTGGTFAWTKPAGFDAALDSAIRSQPAYMGGYGGKVENPFPRLPGTSWFSGLQVTDVDAVALGEFFGRWCFRFHVDSTSLHSNGLRAEFTGGGDYRFEAGQSWNYRFGTYFPREYRNSSWTEWNLFAQFHGPGFGAWGLKTSGGYLHMIPPGAAADAHRVPMPAREQWHDFSWTVHWSPGSSGWATLDVDGVRVFEHRGPTMHADEPYYYPKFGSYLANNPYTQVTYGTPWVVTRL
jgi:hypothetical protein